MADGSRRTYHDFARVVIRFTDIFQFRIVQKALNRFQIEVVADTAYLNRIRNEMIQQLKKAFPPSTDFDILMVKRIETDQSGKMRKLISLVSRDAI